MNDVPPRRISAPKGIFYCRNGTMRPEQRGLPKIAVGAENTPGDTGVFKTSRVTLRK